MHGLVNRAIQRFVADSYGEEKWRATMKGAGLCDFGTGPDQITPTIQSI